jgi:hypothetical protein
LTTYFAAPFTGCEIDGTDFFSVSLVRLRHKIQKPSNEAKIEGLRDRLLLPEITARAGSPFDL